ncbi:MAG: hypothetical protein JJT95_09660 [Pararhodobacter sp.]|nr:hypothetical protein [Pararhodobacter sp.]
MNRDTLRRRQGIAQLEERDVRVLSHQIFEKGLIRGQFALARGVPLGRRASVTAHPDRARPLKPSLIFC